MGLGARGLGFGGDSGSEAEGVMAYLAFGFWVWGLGLLWLSTLGDVGCLTLNPKKHPGLTLATAKVKPWNPNPRPLRPPALDPQALNPKPCVPLHPLPGP